MTQKNPLWYGQIADNGAVSLDLGRYREYTSKNNRPDNRKKQYRL